MTRTSTISCWTQAVMFPMLVPEDLEIIVVGNFGIGLTVFLPLEHPI